MKKLLPFVATAVVSGAFTVWLVFNTSRTWDVAMLKARADLAEEEQKKLSDKIDVLMFTKSGDFRFPDPTNTFKDGVSLGKKMKVPVVDYR